MTYDYDLDRPRVRVVTSESIAYPTSALTAKSPTGPVHPVDGHVYDLVADLVTPRTTALACSFSPETEVVMADGTAKPISEVEIRIGDEVLAVDPETGQRGTRQVLNLNDGHHDHGSHAGRGRHRRGHARRPRRDHHHTDSQHRLVKLAVQGQTANSVDVRTPTSADAAPPGYYMLFILAGGIPSVAEFIEITA